MCTCQSWILLPRSVVWARREGVVRGCLRFATKEQYGANRHATTRPTLCIPARSAADSMDIASRSNNSHRSVESSEVAIRGFRDRQFAICRALELLRHVNRHPCVQVRVLLEVNPDRDHPKHQCGEVDFGAEDCSV